MSFDPAKPFETFERYAFRLEALPQYLVEDERESFMHFQKTGEIIPHNSGWTKLVAANTKAGKKMERLRLLSEVPTDYERYELQIYSGPEGGEVIRTALRKQYEAEYTYDFWFFDDQWIAQVYYEADGTFIKFDVRTATKEEKRAYEHWYAVFEKATPLRNSALYDKAQNYLLSLGDVSTRFARVERAPRYTDGRRESDVEHSFHLALSATELAAHLYPKLDQGLVAQFSLVHDLPEVYAGDVWTVHITDEELAKKHAAEAEAAARLMKELPPHLADLLERYEKQEEPEARFVRFVDKIVPAIINIVADEASTFSVDHKIGSPQDYKKARAGHLERIRIMFPEYAELEPLVLAIWDTHTERMFS